jgi:transposase-like protein
MGYITSTIRKKELEEGLVTCTVCKKRKPLEEYNPSRLKKRMFRCSDCERRERLKYYHPRKLRINRKKDRASFY